MSPSHAPSHIALLARGHTWHQRLRPRGNRFRYAVYFLMLPMRSLARNPEQGMGLARNRFGLLSFYDSDHGEPLAGGLQSLAWIESLLKQEGLEEADGEIWLQTFPRVLGFVFKPVSFWFCERRDGSLVAVVAEVNNTFGERHAYFLDARQAQRNTTMRARKVFHVSPFCDVAGDYQFRFVRQGNLVMSTVELQDAQGSLLQTSWTGRTQALTSGAMRRAFFSMPLMTLGIVAKIHWQALILWFKRTPFYRQPPLPKDFVSR